MLLYLIDYCYKSHTGLLCYLFFEAFLAFRYLIGDDRAIFLFKDGSQAWDAKNFLVEQEKCSQVVIESKAYPGPAFIEVSCPWWQEE